MQRGLEVERSGTGVGHRQLGLESGSVQRDLMSAWPKQPTSQNRRGTKKKQKQTNKQTNKQSRRFGSGLGKRATVGGGQGFSGNRGGSSQRGYGDPVLVLLCFREGVVVGRRSAAKTLSKGAQR